MKIIYKILIFITLFLICAEASAQKKRPIGRAHRRITADIRFGLNMSDMDMKGGNDYSKVKYGFQMGGLVNFKVKGDFQFQTGLFVTKKGMKREQYSYQLIEGEPPEELVTDKRTTIDASYFQIPFNIGFEHFFTPDFAVNINVGPYLAYGIKGQRYTKGSLRQLSPGGGSSQEKETYETGKVKTFDFGSLKRTDYGVGVNLGIVYDIYTLSFGYDHGMANVSDKDKEVLKNRNMYIGAGFRF